MARERLIYDDSRDLTRPPETLRVLLDSPLITSHRAASRRLASLAPSLGLRPAGRPTGVTNADSGIGLFDRVEPIPSSATRASDYDGMGRAIR